MRCSGMSALSSQAVQQRLTVIMDALSRAAVAEICELLDGSYARLCTELERTQRENEDLKKKLHVIETIVVRCDDGGGGGAGGGGGGGGNTTEPEELAPGLAAEGRQKEPRRRAEDGRDAAAAHPGGAAQELEVTVVQHEELPEVVLIKDEDSDSDDASQQDASTPISHSAKRRWTGSETGGRKSPPKAPRVAAGRQKRGGLSVFTVEPPPRELGRPERADNAASAGSQGKQEAEGQDVATQSGFAEPPSPSNRAAPDLKAMWTDLPKDPMTVSHLHQDDNAFGIKLVSVSGSASAEYQAAEAAEAASYAPYREQRAAQPAAGNRRNRGKRFTCCVCSKTYATAQNLDVHMRIHTGVRPFSCEHCGKTFLQSAHLKSHLSIHTGKRQHVCLICSRSFVVKYSLKLHMKKCHVSPC